MANGPATGAAAEKGPATGAAAVNGPDRAKGPPADGAGAVALNGAADTGAALLNGAAIGGAAALNGAYDALGAGLNCPEVVEADEGACCWL